jgi:hypothetical protein
MPTGYQRVDFGPFLGLNEDENLTALRDGELQIAENCAHIGSVLHTRPGLIEDPDGDYETANIPDATRPVEGAYEFRKDFDATRTLLVIHDGKVYTDYTVPTVLTKGGTVTLAQTAASGKGNPWTFAQWRNTVFAAGGAVSDTAWWIDDPSGGGTYQLWEMDDGAGTDVVPKLCFEKWNWVFAARFYQTGTSTISTTSNANALVVRYSDLGAIDNTSEATIKASFPPSNAIGGPGIGGFSADFGNYITGFGEYTDNRGDWLIVGTRRRLYAVQRQLLLDRPLAITDSIPNGLVHQRCFVSLGVDSGDAIYMSDRGIHSLRQSQNHGQRANTFLSWPIRKTFANLTKTQLEGSSGAYWPKEGLVVFAVPAGGESKNSKLLAMDIKNLGANPLGTPRDITADNVRWYIWELSDTDEGPAFVFPARDSNDEPYIYAGTYTGDVGQFQATTFLDLGASYRTRWRTNDRHRGVPSDAHCVFRLRPPQGQPGCQPAARQRGEVGRSLLA